MSGPHKLVQEPDKIATNTVIGVGVGSLALFAVGIIATYGFLRSLGPAIEPVTGSRQVGQAEMGLVNQLPFTADQRFYEQRDQEMKQLGAYGWVDRKAGTVHIPIEHAMELVTEGVRPAPGPKDAQPRAREADVAKTNWPTPIGVQPVPAMEPPRMPEAPKAPPEAPKVPEATPAVPGPTGEPTPAPAGDKQPEPTQDAPKAGEPKAAEPKKAPEPKAAEPKKDEAPKAGPDTKKPEQQP